MERVEERAGRRSEAESREAARGEAAGGSGLARQERRGAGATTRRANRLAATQGIRRHWRRNFELSVCRHFCGGAVSAGYPSRL